MSKKTIFFLPAMLIFCATLFLYIEATAQEAPIISVAIAKLSSDRFEADRMEQALDAYVFEKLGFHVRLEYLPYMFSGSVMGDYLLSGSLPDVFLLTRQEDYDLLQDSGCLLPLDDLLKTYGQELTAQCTDRDLRAHTNDADECCAIPCIHTRAWSIGFEYRKDIAEKYDLAMDQIRSMEDLTEIFARLRERAPDIIPVLDAHWMSWDPLGDSLGVLMDPARSDTIVNLYETDEYAAMCRTLGAWRQAGYIIDEDYMQRDVNSFVALPEVFGKLADYNPSMQWMDEMEAGEPMAAIRLSDPVILSSAYDMNMWAVFSRTPCPEESMRFLNALYSDPVIANLLAYGIVDENYAFSDEETGLIRSTTGEGEAPGPSYQIRNYLVGNQYLCYKWDNHPADIWDQCRAFDQSAAISAGYGFTFDPESVAGQVRDCLEIVNAYAPALLYGMEDADGVLSAFRLALKDAGIDEIIAEKQRQFDVWKETADQS